ncbi:MAG TPA: TetR/AcrR family transcriptional regulator [Solirubrobacterales bacterium]|nr:TetR/AcrR family transcriptional regulator [Solirubrobacterales bacterium]
MRERLLEGALECLREKGYAATTARDIAAASNANLRSIGYHFDSTKGLLNAAISLNFRLWLQPLIAAATDESKPPAERLRAGMSQFTEALPENGPVLRAWLEAIALAGHDPELSSTLAENQADFRQRLESTLSQAGAANPSEKAAALVAVCDGLIVRFLLHGEVAAPAEASREAAEALGLTL